MLCNIRHGGQRLHRIFAGGGFAGEHHGAGAVIHRLRHIVDLCPGGTGIADHGIQHLRGYNDVFPRLSAASDDFLLEHGHLIAGHLHAEIASGYHNAVCRSNDLIDVVNALLIFNLRNDLHTACAHPLQQIADIHHVLGGPGKGGSNKIKAIFHREQNIAAILRGQERQIHRSPGQIDALVVLHLSAVCHGANHIIPGNLPDNQLNESIIHADAHPGLYYAAEVGIAGGAARLVAHPVIAVKRERLARL